MEIYDRIFESPAENLAADEALLEYCEEHPEHGGFLRFWESKKVFVVLGYSKKWEEEVVGRVCGETRTSILRRCSGGGTVLQGPGCYNYCLVLPIKAHPELETISASNCYIMQQQCEALRCVLGESVRVEGYTDLTFGGLKFSGNSQRRKREFLLFHGVFLLNFDLGLIEKMLRMPRNQPEYRQGRKHLEFLVNIGKSADVIRAAITKRWSEIVGLEGSGAAREEIQKRIAELVQKKYGNRNWNLRI